MSIVIKVKESVGGSWQVCRNADLVSTQPSLGSAIRMARGLGRAIHDDTGIVVLVMMICPIGVTLLARYAQPAERQSAAAA